jgi:hypothetical protein
MRSILLLLSTFCVIFITPFSCIIQKSDFLQYVGKENIKRDSIDDTNILQNFLNASVKNSYQIINKGIYKIQAHDGINTKINTYGHKGLCPKSNMTIDGNFSIFKTLPNHSASNVSTLSWRR